MKACKFIIEFEEGGYSTTTEVETKSHMQQILSQIIQDYGIILNDVYYYERKTLKDLVNDSLTRLDDITKMLDVDVSKFHRDHLDYIYDSFGIKIHPQTTNLD